MLQLSKKVDYALIALMHLAQQGDDTSWSAREIASGYGMPQDLLAKILQRLAREGIVASQQGTKGGYSLARPAASIDVVRVIEAVDGPLSLTQCVSELGNCDQFDTCNIKTPLQRLNDQVLRMLAGVTIAKMCEEDLKSLTGNLGSAQLPVVQPVASNRQP
jgi:Rrf2 family protein